MNKFPLISIILSFRNEQAVLPALIERLEAALDPLGHDYELIFINDASTDESREILLTKMKADRRLKLVNMSRPFGGSPGVLAGLELAAGDIVVYLDADLQDPPELIPELIKTWQEQKVDIVNTKRLSRAGEPWLRLLATKVGYSILEKVSRVHLEPEVSDFKLLSRRAVNELIRLKEKAPFLRGLVQWVGFPQATLTYHRAARFAGKAKFSAFNWSIFSNFVDSALISFSDRPLKLSLLLGLIISVFAFGYLVVSFFVPGWSVILAALLLLGGIQLLSIGLLGLYINAIYVETKPRPNYIIESKYGFEPGR